MGLTRLDNLLNKLVDVSGKNVNGNRIRQVVRILAKKYKNSPENLVEFMSSKNPLVSGIGVSVYAMLTEDYDEICNYEFGGLGFISNDSEYSLSLDKNQGWAQKLSGTAGYEQELDGNSGLMQVLLDKAGREQVVSDYAAYKQELHGTSAMRQELFGPNAAYEQKKIGPNAGNGEKRFAE